MQLKLIVIIIISIGVALFALQNVEPVTVSLASGILMAPYPLCY